MFSKSEVKTAILALGRKWLFPDFSNKLTWLVATVGAGIIVTPVLLKEIVYNWLIDTFNLNAGEHLKLAALMPSGADYLIGFSLIAFALLHNVSSRYFGYRMAQMGDKYNQDILAADRKLFDKFLEVFPSNSPSARLLHEHDFGNSFHEGNTDQIDNFVSHWGIAEMCFHDAEIEEAKAALYTSCRKLVYELSSAAFYIGAGPMLTCIPDAFRGAWQWPPHVEQRIRELNELASTCHSQHQSFIATARRRLKV